MHDRLILIQVSNQQGQSSQPNSSSVSNMYNQQAALAAAQYSIGTGFPSSASAQSYYGTPQPQGSTPQYTYANYSAYQQATNNDSHQ